MTASDFCNRECNTVQMQHTPRVTKKAMLQQLKPIVLEVSNIRAKAALVNYRR